MWLTLLRSLPASRRSFLLRQGFGGHVEGQTFQILLMRHLGVDREEKIKLA